MNKILITLSVILIALSSCEKNTWEDRLTDRIEGHWVYEKAKYQAKLFCREDRLGDFENDHIYFYKDGTLEIINEVDNVYYEGIYSFERTTVNNYNNWNDDNIGTPTTVFQEGKHQIEC